MLRSVSQSRGHAYKLYNSRCDNTTRRNFFVERVVNVWNSLPCIYCRFYFASQFRAIWHQHWLFCIVMSLKQTLSRKNRQSRPVRLPPEITTSGSIETSFRQMALEQRSSVPFRRLLFRLSVADTDGSRWSRYMVVAAIPAATRSLDVDVSGVARWSS